MHLGEVDGCRCEQWEVESVKPDHWCGPLVAMVVPMPAGREYHIAAVHKHLLPLDRGEATTALHDEAHRECDVPVSRRYLTGENQLKATIDSVGGIRRDCCRSV